MAKLDLNKTKIFVAENIGDFHQSRLECLKNLKLKTILKKKNPYLFRAKNINIASELVSGIMDAYLSSAEEELFGNFLEDLALFIASNTRGAQKSSSEGIDFEFIKDNVHYIISVKSGPNWGNSSQQRKLEEDFKKAVKVLKQSKHTSNVEAILGICYGKTKTSFLRGYWKYVGQIFWHFISGEKELYKDIIEPIGYKAKEHNEAFLQEKARLVNLFTEEFMKDFCEDGRIDWKKLVEFNSGNLNLA
jgi:hypothetical protein